MLIVIATVSITVKIAAVLGLDDERFCKMIMTTKMLLSNVLGHAAELHYENYMKKNGIKYKNAPTDEHYDFIIENERHQVKRFETITTNTKYVGANLTKTHGNRNGPDAFYKRTDFDKLVIFDVGFKEPMVIDVKSLPVNPAYSDRMPRKFSIKRGEKNLDRDDLEFLKIMSTKNEAFAGEIESFRKKRGWNYAKLLEHSCNLSLEEVDGLFSDENFRLVTGVKGFAAEEHFNILLDDNEIPYRQNPDMYSKIDHWVKGKIRVQVKTPHGRSTNSKHWGVKLHKSHGHGKGELCPVNAFDVLALFVGFKMEYEKSRYFPVEARREFLFVPIDELPRHPEYPDYLKRIAPIDEARYKINDLSIFNLAGPKKKNLQDFLS